MGKSFLLFENMVLTTITQRGKSGFSCRLFVVLSIGLVLSGCGGSSEKLRPVSGKVTFQGKPVAAGTIRFSNTQAGIDMTAQLRPDGTYEVVMARGAGLPEGTYQVAVMPPKVSIPLGPMKEPAKPQKHPDIPEKYRSPSTSGLTLTVKSGDNRLDVDMQP